ncbi:NUDIX domain-containing protein [Rhizobium sp. P40RR-XXII]|uniref:NUDIX domain-containing protein n=1 Tax=Rhizobium sp. P40RR-XXII TaxID=2726739 RepID=UPI0014568B42|nr:NUDIX domain-containing protein [Rhizobium sp. P40RR-XXII]NLS20439.1 NUDIX domain-containing protein [Rhizobium sp. P40RR-XXII]
MARKSAGILVYRVDRGELEVLLVHPGGPYWQKRDIGAWQIPKGELFDNEEPDVAARREFVEETGWVLKEALYPLGEIRQHGGKSVTAFATEGAFLVSTLVSQAFDIEWPPHSGLTQSFPEVDRAEWFTVVQAYEKMLDSQRPFLDRLIDFISRGSVQRLADMP